VTVVVTASVRKRPNGSSARPGSRSEEAPVKTEQFPPRPDEIAPAQETKRWWKKGWVKVALVVFGLYIVGDILLALNEVAVQETQQETVQDIYDDLTAAPTAPPIEDNESGHSRVELIVTLMPPSQIRSFCRGYDLVGNYDLAFAAFKRGYTSRHPSPEVMFNELLSRC
jgi:hypothetical protein